jgi:3-hydroxyacyl-CoA dehydrogenase/enoyl-CoA hydratase/3-hydroxybutyryl-CoA epimerase
VRWEWGDDGIVIVVLDDPGRTTNMINVRHYDGMNACLDDLESRRGDLRGVIITSAKRSFFSGMDGDPGEVPAEEAAGMLKLQVPVRDQLRRLELLGRPVAAAMTGSALGGGLETCLACHFRVGLDAPGVFWGLAEVGMGLLPGCGGLVRATRMFGVAAVVERIVGPGTVYTPVEALQAGLVDALAPTREAVIDLARAWIEAQPAGGQFVQRWERPGYRVPGPVPGTPQFAALVEALAADADARPGSAFMPARRAIADVASASVQVEVDEAFPIETSHFLSLLPSPARANMSKAYRLDAYLIASGAGRPGGGQRWEPRRVAVLGDGPLASAVLERCGKAGWPVVRTASIACDLVIDLGSGRMTIDGAPVGLHLYAPAERPELLKVFFGGDGEAPIAEIVCPQDAPDTLVAQALSVANSLTAIPVLVRGQQSFIQPIADALGAEAEAMLAEGAGDVPDRLIMAGATAARRAWDNGTAVDAADANAGSLLGAGFPEWTGGVAQYIAAFPGGSTAFAAHAKELQARHGERFSISMPLASIHQQVRVARHREVRHPACVR